MRSLHFVWGLRTGNRFVRNFSTCSTARLDSKYREDINLGLVYQGNCNYCISRLQECAKKQYLTKGRHVHAQIIRNRIGPHKLLWNALINMYIKCRTIRDACLLFNSMFNQDVFTWTIMITGHAEVGDCNQVFALFEQMRQCGMAPNKVTYVSILCACARANALEQGKCIHAFIIRSITYLDIFVENALINMYAKCGSIYDASQLFAKMLDPDMVSWNAVISGYVQDGDGEKARNMFVQMQEIGLQPSKITYLTMLSSCTNQGWGKLLHALLLRNELKLEVFLGTALLAMYVKYGNIVDAWQVFDRIPEKNAVSWTVMISSYTEYGNRSQALTLFEEMQYYFTPNRVTYINMLNACGSAVEFVKILHSHLLKFNIQLDMFIENKLLDIYIKCGNSEVAQQIFDRLQERDVVSWTSMVSGYAENQNGFGALKLFLELLHSGLEPNQATFVSVLCGCSSATALQWGRFIHAYVIQAGLNSEIFVSNSNIAMYIACGSIDDAWQVFKLMPSPDVVSCTAMLSGLVQFGDASNAIKLYHQMQHYDLELNKVTYLSAISACSSFGGLECARHVHNDVIKLGLDSDIILGNSLIGMYAKCGCIDDARHVFDKMSAKDDVTWISLISGYAQNGCGNDVMKLFKEMLSNGFKPDNLVLVSLLVACGHIGLLDVGYNCFVAMGHLYEIKLTADHYACMVDHLGHAGNLTEAKDLIDAMPFEPDVPVWLAFVTACRVHRDLKLANIIVGNVDG